MLAGKFMTTCLFVLVEISFSSPSRNFWTHHLVLDKENHFHVSWTPTNNSITFRLEVRTRGYVAIGFSPHGGMQGADIAFGWVSGGQGHLQDRHATDNSAPMLDDTQNLLLLDSQENDTHTILTFSRPWDTCDNKQDMALSGDTTRLIWAYHYEDPPADGYLHYHGSSRRGVRSVYLKEASQLSQSNSRLAHLKEWKLLPEEGIRLPDDDHTHYWCQIFKAPELTSKHHMVALRPHIQPGREPYVHHMVLYECHVPNDSSELWFERHVGSGGEACYSPNMPPEWSFCLATNTWAWAIGSEGEDLPEHVGMPLGEEYGGATYFMLETHYDNPDVHQDIVDKSGIKILYTDRVRQFDTAMLLVGSEVNFLHVIPPGQQSFRTAGRCTQACTENTLPPDGIQVLSGVLHSHLSGRRIKLRHVRNGTELPPILEDANYDFNFQASRRPEHGRGKVMPGDELILECDYDTSSRSKPTFGGLSTREEMCLGFIIYYPRSQLADCRSLPTLDTAMHAFGIDSIYGMAFAKLVAFMKDIGTTESAKENTLKNLLDVLALENDQEKLSNSKGKDDSYQPLSEEDLLQKPFYTVQTADESADETYRTLLPRRLLNVRIKEPASLHNVTVGQRFATMDWTDPKVGRRVQDAIQFGQHNALCLGHGRVPKLPYEESPYPNINRPYLRQQTCSRSFKTKKLMTENVPKSFQLSIGHRPEAKHLIVVIAVCLGFQCCQM